MPPTHAGESSPDFERFTHRFLAAGESGTDPGYALLLLHGTGGDENDLLPLGVDLAPGAALLSPRGRVLEAGMPRFFRRVSEGVFDVEDLKARASELAAFLRAARSAYSLGERALVGVGFSNGANIAGALLIAHPGSLQGAVLLRPMIPYTPDTPPSLAGVPILIAAGTHDPFGSPDQIEGLATVFRSGGASVDIHQARAGHNLTTDDVEASRVWLAGRFGGRAGER